MFRTATRIRALLLGLLTTAALSMGFEAASPEQGRFIPAVNMTTPRSSHTATLLYDGKVLLAGGSIVPTSAEVYDPATGIFMQTGHMTTGRSSHSATLLPNGRVLIVGGAAPSAEATAEIYDPVTGTFTATGNLVGRHISPRATLLDNGKVLIAASHNFKDGPTASHPELYDPATGIFSQTGNYAPTGAQNPYEPWGKVSASSVWLPNHKVLFTSEPFGELYNSDTAQFGLTGAMLTQAGYVGGRTATLLPTGKVLLAGGDHEDNGYFIEGELYDPATGKFTAAGRLPSFRSSHQSTILHDGTLLLTGGDYGPRVLGSTAIYDPSTGSFNPGPNLTWSRSFHTATRLLDGRVLLAGGNLTFPGSSSATADLYVPALSTIRPQVTQLHFDRAIVVAGTSYGVTITGTNITSQTYFDIRFTSPGNRIRDVFLNWQKGPTGSYFVPIGLDAGDWTITEVRAHQLDTDHTGEFFRVNSTITVVP